MGAVTPAGLPAAAGLAGYRRLLGYAVPYARAWALVAVVSALGTLVTLLQPWPMQVVVDHVLARLAPTGPTAWLQHALPGARTPTGLLAWAVLAGLVLHAVHAAVEAVLTRAWVRVGRRMVHDATRDLFARLQRRSMLFHARQPVGDSLAQVTGDSWSVHAAVDSLVFAPGHALVTAAGLLVVMARLDPALTLVTLVASPLMAAGPLIARRPLRAASEARREVEGRLQAHVQQTLSAVAVVQAFGQEEREHGRFRAYAAEAVRAHRRAAVATGLADLGAGLAATLATIAVTGYGVSRVLEGRLSTGTVLVFLAYLVTLQEQIRTFAKAWAALQTNDASARRVLEALAGAPEVGDAPGARARAPGGPGALVLEGVTAGYAAGRPVLHGVSLTVAPGETVALVGASGAGKSTLAALVPRFLDPWAGRVLLDGADVRTLTLASVREAVALVLQQPVLFPLSVAENIAYGRPGASRAAVEAAARAAEAHAFIAALPAGYDTVLGAGGATLSGGERQRLAIARALLKDAPVLVLDEPTSALDPVTERAVLTALGRLTAGRTTLLIAHRRATVERADRVVVLAGGRVVEAGAPAVLRARGGAYARLLAAADGDWLDAPPPGAD